MERKEMLNKSVLGYSRNSPYKGNPYIDITTPEGLIDMSNTDIPLYAEDETGYGKYLAPGSGMHKFPGKKVREIPMRKQFGGYQDVYDYLFGDDEDEVEDKPINQPQPQEDDEPLYQQPNVDDDYNSAMDVVNMGITQGNDRAGYYRRMNENMELSPDRSYNPAAFSLPTYKNPGQLNPSIQKTQTDLYSEFPEIKDMGTWGDKSHQARVSDHNTGDAWDVGVPSSSGKTLVEKLRGEAKDRNIKYIIYNGKIWNPTVSSEWRDYTGPDKHTDHAHISYNR